MHCPAAPRICALCLVPRRQFFPILFSPSLRLSALHPPTYSPSSPSRPSFCNSTESPTVLAASLRLQEQDPVGRFGFVEGANNGSLRKRVTSPSPLRHHHLFQPPITSRPRLPPSSPPSSSLFNLSSQIPFITIRRSSLRCGALPPVTSSQPHHAVWEQPCIRCPDWFCPPRSRPKALHQITHLAIRLKLPLHRQSPARATPIEHLPADSATTPDPFSSRKPSRCR